MDLAAPARDPSRGRFSRRRGRPARVRWQRQAAARLRPRHRGLGRGGARPRARRGQRHRGRATTGADWWPGRSARTSPRWSGAWRWSSAGHPLRMRGAMFDRAAQPSPPQRAHARLPAADHAGAPAPAGRRRNGRRACCSDWSAPGWPDHQTEQVVPDGHAGFRRWRTRRWSTTAGSSVPPCAPDGLRYTQRMRAPIGGRPCRCTARWTLRSAGYRARRGPPRRGPVPVADDRRRRSLPAGGAGQPVRRRAARLAARPRARALTAGRGRLAAATGRRDPTRRNARPRDGLGRPLPRGAEGAARVPDDLLLPPGESLALADRLLAAGTPLPRPRGARGVLESRTARRNATSGRAWPSWPSA